DAAGPGRGAERAAEPATPGRRGERGRAAAAARGHAGDGPAGGDRPAAGTGRVLAVPAPALAAVGRARTRDRPPGPVRAHGARRVAGPDVRRQAGAAGALRHPAASAGADVLACPGAVELRRS